MLSLGRPLRAVYLAFAVLATSQTPTAQVMGRVADASQVLMAGEQIAVVGVDTGLQRRAVSNEAGYFAITFSRPVVIALRFAKTASARSPSLDSRFRWIGWRGSISPWKWAR